MIWILICAIAGAAIGFSLLGLMMHSTLLGVIGAIVGFVLGALFGKLVPLSEVLLGIFD